MTTISSHIAVGPAVKDRVAELQQLDSLRQLPFQELHLLAEHAVLRVFEPRSALIMQQTVARTVFLILSGALEQTMLDGHGDERMLALLGRGDLFGEGGLFGLRYRRTTVRATTRSYVLQLRYADLQEHAHQLPYFFNTLRSQFRNRLLQTTLVKVPLLASLDTVERLSLAQQLDDRRVDRGETILEAGGMSDGLYIVAEGQARVVRDGQSLAVLEPGDLFGEMSLLDGAAHEASIVALTPVHLLFLPRATFEYLLSRRPDIAEQLRWISEERRRIDRRGEHVAVTSRLIETGVIRGKMALARRVDLCDPSCRRCEEACGSRFRVPRLSFTGAEAGPFELADTCHHCQWGAECVDACPEDAFRLDHNGYLLITDRCTGCGACVDACPYHAINQVPVYAPATNPVMWLLRQFGGQQPDMLRANKCDACYGYDDHACITACPTGALSWVPIKDFYAATPG